MHGSDTQSNNLAGSAMETVVFFLHDCILAVDGACEGGGMVEVSTSSTSTDNTAGDSVPARSLSHDMPRT